MANKTAATDADVPAYIEQLPDTVRRKEANALSQMLASLVGEPPVLWGPSIIGFGQYQYRHESGRTGEMCRIGFSPRKAELVLYLVGGFDRHQHILARLGKHRTGKSCLYVKRLSDVDLQVLQELLSAELTYMDATYPRT